MRTRLCCLSCLLALCSVAAAGEYLTWQELPEPPPAPGQTEQIGVAGPFAGVHNDALIVAGGANFPDAPPWEGGRKVWWDDVFVLMKGADGKPQWITDAALKLDLPLAYGAAVSAKGGVVCIGGCDAERCYRDVFLLAWDPDREAKAIATKPLPSLPRPLAFMAAAKIGTTVYVVGGQEAMKDARATTSFLALKLSKDEDEADGEWQELPSCPGPPRILPVVAAQSDGVADCVYVFSGRNIAPGKPTEVLTDAYRYNPKTKEWTRLADIAPEGEAPRCVMAGTGYASGANHVLVFGGGNGALFLELERLAQAIQEAEDDAVAEPLKAKQREMLTNHPGFSRDILAYHTVTDTWVNAGELPTTSHVTTVAVRWGDAFVIPSGEIRPGVRTPKVWAAEPLPAGGLGTAGYVVLGAYVVVLVGMGVYFARREKTTEDFFKAGRRIPWWAAGISIYGTQLSAITFMSIPAKTFATDWRLFLANMAILMVAPFIIFLFLPFYRRLDVTTAYEYLEKRFNVGARLLASVMFMLFQFGRIGIVLFLPSLALRVVTGIDVSVCILVMGLLCIVYTVLGGIEAVIWTDVLQVVVLLGGAVLCLILIPFHVPGGWNGMNEIAEEAGKLRLLDFRWDVAKMTFWTILLGGFAANIISYGSDQTVIQRYLTTKDEKAAGRSIWTNALMCLPGSLLFFGMGTALFVFYKSNPAALNPTLSDPDAIFPFYIVTQLPAVLAGVLIAGVFAAAMSSLDSSMNSVATAFTTDFYRRFTPDAPDHRCLTLARMVTVVAGLLGTGFALTMAQWDIKSLWDQFSTVLGLFGGGLGGLFLLAIFTRRTHGLGAIIGLLGSGVVQYLIKTNLSLDPRFLAVTGIGSCFVIAYVASLLIPAARKPLDGLTLHTLRKAE